MKAPLPQTPARQSQSVAIARRMIRRENARHGRAITEIPREEWPTNVRAVSLAPSRVWRSRDILAQLFIEPSGAKRLTISTTELLPSGDWRDGLRWETLQAIKSELGFGDQWAVEVFPPDAETVNVANMRHLWLLPSPPHYGWKSAPDNAQLGNSNAAASAPSQEGRPE